MRIAEPRPGCEMREHAVDVLLPTGLIDDRQLVVVIAGVLTAAAGEGLGDAGEVYVRSETRRGNAVEKTVELVPCEPLRDRAIGELRLLAKELVACRPASLPP